MLTMKKNKLYGAAGTIALLSASALFVATPAQALSCYDTVDLEYPTWTVETWQEVTPAVPAVPAIPGTPAIPAVPESFAALGNYADTRATGHYAGGVDGLHIWTEGTTSTDKVAGYLDIADEFLADAATGGASLGYVVGFGITPGAQLVVDINGDGVGDGILVGESVYGDNWWLTNGSSAAFKALDPSGAENGGNGSEWFGTLAQWTEQAPLAKVTHVGFSLGSGVFGDGTVTGFTLNGTTHSFVQTIPGTPEVPAVPEVPEVPAVPAVFDWVVESTDNWGEEVPADTETVRHTDVGSVLIPTEVEVECPAPPAPPANNGGGGTTTGGAVKASNNSQTLAETGGGDVNPILPIGGALIALLGGSALLTARILRQRTSMN